MKKIFLLVSALVLVASLAYAEVTSSGGAASGGLSSITADLNALVAGLLTPPIQVIPAQIVPVVSPSLEACRVLKASAGTLYSLGVTIQATTGIVQVFNLASAPSDGAVTPVWSSPILSNGTLGGATWAWDAGGISNTVGIVVCFSSATTPFTKTASATAMFSAEVQ